jgi:hypothetical protein
VFDESPTGADAVNATTLVEELPPGADCARGGARVSSGIDTNGNGALDPSEGTHTANVCNGADGTASLIITDKEPAGTNCKSGGTNITTGRGDGKNGRPPRRRSPAG